MNLIWNDFEIKYFLFIFADIKYKGAHEKEQVKCVTVEYII